MNLTAMGVDTAKNVFQVHYVDMETGEIVNKPIKRSSFLAFFVNRPPCLIGMEACGGAHHWARELRKQGHQVRLMPRDLSKRSMSATRMMRRMPRLFGWPFSSQA